MKHITPILILAIAVFCASSCKREGVNTYEKEMSGIFKGPESCSDGSTEPEITFTIQETGARGSINMSYTWQGKTLNFTAKNNKFIITADPQVVNFNSVVYTFQATGQYEPETKKLQISFFFSPNSGFTMYCNATLYKF